MVHITKAISCRYLTKKKNSSIQPLQSNTKYKIKTEKAFAEITAIILFG